MGCVFAGGVGGVRCNTVFQFAGNCGSSDEVWIAFIGIPYATDQTAVRIHSARNLAKKCEFEKPHVFYHEIVFEWAIPESYVLHMVSLQTLLERGLPELYFIQKSTKEVRRYHAIQFQQQSPWEIGVTLGVFAKKFGARAPLKWVAYQLFHDCVRVRVLDDDVIEHKYAHRDTAMVDFQFCSDLADGVDTSLFEWWLSDIDFVLDYEEFKEWRAVTEDSMIWDLIEFWETWHELDYDGTVVELCTGGKPLHDLARKKLSIKHDENRAAIEKEAVKIGL